MRQTGQMVGAVLLAVATVVGTNASAHAAPITFFGEDLNPGGTVPSGGDAAQARSNFLASLSGGVGTEDFESFADGNNAPITLSFPGSTGSIAATLHGDGLIEDDSGGGRFATSGTNFFESDEIFDITFDSPIAAFGFFGTDIGDVGGQMTLTLSNGSTEVLTVPHTDYGSSGSLLFFGFIDNTNTYTKIAFSNSSGGSDTFGFDDMTIGDLQQVQPVVPEPASMTLLGIGAIGLLGGYGRRRKRRTE